MISNNCGTQHDLCTDNGHRRHDVLRSSVLVKVAPTRSTCAGASAAAAVNWARPTERVGDVQCCTSAGVCVPKPGGGCLSGDGKKTKWEAEALCMQHGLRLCVASELACCTQGTALPACVACTQTTCTVRRALHGTHCEAS